jgi:hypothetical protein
MSRFHPTPFKENVPVIHGSDPRSRGQNPYRDSYKDFVPVIAFKENIPVIAQRAHGAHAAPIQ